MITYKDLQGKLKTLHDKALTKAVAKLNKELKRKDLVVVIGEEYGNGGDYALSLYLKELQNTEIGLLWLLFGNPGWDGYEDEGTDGQDVFSAIIESGQYDDDLLAWDYNKSIPKEIKKFMDEFDRIYNEDEDEDLSEANKYFFGTESTSTVRKLFENSQSTLQTYKTIENMMETFAKDFNNYLLKLSKGDKKSIRIMTETAIEHGILNGHTPWDGMDMVLGLFENVTSFANKIDKLDLYPFVNSDGDMVENLDDLYPALLPFIDELLQKHCVKGFTALWNKIHDDTKSKVTYNDFCGEEHCTANINGLGF